LFACQKKQQARFFLKDLIPLAAIGRAYVWRSGGTGQQGRAKSGWRKAKLCLSAPYGDFRLMKNITAPKVK
jgi:hypothetical protein